MSFKINETEIVIDGKSIVKALVLVYLAKKLYNAMSKPKQETYVVFQTEIKNAKTKNKVESV